MGRALWAKQRRSRMDGAFRHYRHGGPVRSLRSRCWNSDFCHPQKPSALADGVVTTLPDGSRYGLVQAVEWNPTAGRVMQGYHHV